MSSAYKTFLAISKMHVGVLEGRGIEITEGHDFVQTSDFMTGREHNVFIKGCCNLVCVLRNSLGCS